MHADVKHLTVRSEALADGRLTWASQLTLSSQKQVVAWCHERMPDDVVEMALMINAAIDRDDPSEILLSCSRKPEVRARDSNHSIGSSSHPRLHLMPGLPSTLCGAQPAVLGPVHGGRRWH